MGLADFHERLSPVAAPAAANGERLTAIEREWLEGAEQMLRRNGLVGTAQLGSLEACRELINAKIPTSDDLWDSCAHGADCLHRDRGVKPKHMRPRLPWVGPRYAEGRIAVVAINSRDDGLPDAEIKAAVQVIDSLRQGHRGFGPNSRSFFHYRVASAVHAVLLSQEGRLCDERPDPSRTADALLSCARLQAVQCSPLSTSRRSPTSAMVRNCPEFLLRDQLEVLAPDVLLLFGQAAHRAIETPPLQMIWDITWANSDRCFSRGQTTLAKRPLTVCAFSHPSTPRWSRSWRAYRESLRVSALSAAAP